jgi:hypothetical protein
MLTKIYNRLKDKSNSFLLWGLTIALFFLFQFNREDLGNAWAGVVSLPEMHKNFKEVKEKISDLDSANKVMHSVTRQEVGWLKKDVESLKVCTHKNTENINQLLIKMKTYEVYNAILNRHREVSLNQVE